MIILEISFSGHLHCRVSVLAIITFKSCLVRVPLKRSSSLRSLSQSQSDALATDKKGSSNRARNMRNTYRRTRHSVRAGLEIFPGPAKAAVPVSKALESGGRCSG